MLAEASCRGPSPPEGDAELLSCLGTTRAVPQAQHYSQGHLLFTGTCILAQDFCLMKPALVLCPIMHLCLIHGVCFTNRGRVVRAQECSQTVCPFQIKLLCRFQASHPPCLPTSCLSTQNREADGAGHIPAALIPLYLGL